MNYRDLKQKKTFLYCAFLGDVHCIIISKTRARKLTKNHNIEDREERKRIEDIGGVIYDEKVYGQENLTRAFGMSFKTIRYYLYT